MLSLQSIPVPFVVGGAVILYLLIRRFAKTDRTNLGDEIRNERESLCSIAESLAAQLGLARRSRIAVAESRGLVESEAMQRWLSEFDTDLEAAKLLASQLPAADVGSTGDQSAMQLEIRLFEILALSIHANRLADKYRLSLSEDAADSERMLAVPGSQPERGSQAGPAPCTSETLAA